MYIYSSLSTLLLSSFLPPTENRGRDIYDDGRAPISITIHSTLLKKHRNNSSVRVCQC